MIADLTFENFLRVIYGGNKVAFYETGDLKDIGDLDSFAYAWKDRQPVADTPFFVATAAHGEEGTVVAFERRDMPGRIAEFALTFAAIATERRPMAFANDATFWIAPEAADTQLALVVALRRARMFTGMRDDTTVTPERSEVETLLSLHRQRVAAAIADGIAVPDAVRNAYLSGAEFEGLDVIPGERQTFVFFNPASLTLSGPAR